MTVPPACLVLTQVLVHVQAQRTLSVPARFWGQLSSLSASEPKLMGKTNDQKEEAKPRARARARTQPLLLGWKYWKPSLGHLEMLIRLANSHALGLPVLSWVCRLTLSMAASVPFFRAIPRGLNSPNSSLISCSAWLPAGRIFSTA